MHILLKYNSQGSHGSVAQLWVSNLSPTHFPDDLDRLWRRLAMQVRNLDCIPVPHVLLQSVHSDHLPHPFNVAAGKKKMLKEQCNPKSLKFCDLKTWKYTGFSFSVCKINLHEE